MAKHSHLPKYNELLNPLFQALHDQMAVNSGPDRFSTIFIHHARFDTQRTQRGHAPTSCLRHIIPPQLGSYASCPHIRLWAVKPIFEA